FRISDLKKSEEEEKRGEGKEEGERVAGLADPRDTEEQRVNQIAARTTGPRTRSWVRPMASAAFASAGMSVWGMPPAVSRVNHRAAARSVGSGGKVPWSS